MQSAEAVTIRRASASELDDDGGDKRASEASDAAAPHHAEPARKKRKRAGQLAEGQEQAEQCRKWSGDAELARRLARPARSSNFDQTGDAKHRGEHQAGCQENQVHNSMAD